MRGKDEFDLTVPCPTQGLHPFFKQAARSVRTTHSSQCTDRSPLAWRAAWSHRWGDFLLQTSEFSDFGYTVLVDLTGTQSSVRSGATQFCPNRLLRLGTVLRAYFADGTFSSLFATPSSLYYLFVQSSLLACIFALTLRFACFFRRVAENRMASLAPADALPAIMPTLGGGAVAGIIIGYLKTCCPALARKKNAKAEHSTFVPF